VRVDYHFHTSSSYDSEISLDAVLERAARVGLDVLCVTDHDTIEGAVALAARAGPSLTVVVGCEFTTEDGSHVIGLGLTDLLTERRFLPLLDAIHAQGGRVLLPHPFRRGSGLFRNEARRPAGFVRDALARVDLVECFNGRDSYESNQRSHAFALAHGLAAVAGSDAHAAVELGSVYVEYREHEFVHGASARRVFFPPQPPVTENPLKRRLLELYHGHKEALPPFVSDAYRALRRRLRRDAPRPGDAPPALHYEFTSTVVTHAS
jgi:predicted metal-dependent phosphoesterase TrpH